jgi:hypothetical protein
MTEDVSMTGPSYYNAHLYPDSSDIAVTDECSECGALVGSERTHTAWHRRLAILAAEVEKLKRWREHESSEGRGWDGS